MLDEVDRARALTFAAAMLSDLPPEQIDPALTDGPTEAERLIATAVARGVVEHGARALTRTGDLNRARTPFDLTLRELHALAAICSQVEPWLRLEVMRGKTLQDVLEREDVPSRIKENVAFLMNWAGWLSAPDARFRLAGDDCDECGREGEAGTREGRPPLRPACGPAADAPGRTKDRGPAA